MKLKTILTESDEQKYEGKYFNGGFNEKSVKIVPSNDGRLSISVNIYGGGEQKSVNISPKKTDIKKILTAYQSAVTSNNKIGTKLEPDIDSYMLEVRNKISNQMIELMRQFDNRVKEIILKSI